MSLVFGGLGLRKAVVLVHRSGWGKADVLLWRPAQSTLFLGGKQQPPCSFMQERQSWSPPY
jgi:hypothetical protein